MTSSPRVAMLAMSVVFVVASTPLHVPVMMDTVRVQGSPAPGIPKPVPRERLPEPIRSVLESPVAGEAALLVHDLYRGGHRVLSSEDPSRAFQHPARSPFVRLTESQVRRLVALVLSEESWNPGTKTCICPPTIGCVLRSDTGRLTMLVYHEAAAVALYSDSVGASRDLDHVNLELLLLANEVFPGDSVLASLVADERKRGPSPLLTEGAGEWNPSGVPSN